jgi:hypothetical protein
MRIVNVLFPLMLGAVLLPALELHAQNALGGGNALDNNLGVGTGGVNLPTPVSNFRDRNLVVTGIKRLQSWSGFDGHLKWGHDSSQRGG